MENQQQGQGGGGSQLKTIASDLIDSGAETVVGLLGEIFAQLSDRGIDPQALISEAMGGGGGQQQMQPQGQPAAGGNPEAEAQAMAMEQHAMAAAGPGQRGRITLR